MAPSAVHVFQSFYMEMGKDSTCVLHNSQQTAVKT